MPQVISPTVEHARQQMIDQQVRAWAVFEPTVLDVMALIKREDFVPPPYRNVAFADTSVRLGHDQSMLAPKLDGKILQALQVQPTDHVLDVGAGSGFLAACLAHLGRHVRSLEIFPALAEQARANLHRAAVNNVVVEIYDAMQLDDDQRYDVIALTGSLPVYDVRFQRALKVGGRLFVVVGTRPVMEAVKITRIGADQFKRETLFETVVEPLVNAPQSSGFVF
ncbi:MAG: protein-L-isoaspartate O-methyltransferase [Candidatus Obscuribacterales bacterium]|nr:protein-L-isoaspartate O-methyltransferase [Steroidobacteraceae bacterium]